MSIIIEIRINVIKIFQPANLHSLNCHQHRSATASSTPLVFPASIRLLQFSSSCSYSASAVHLLQLVFLELVGGSTRPMLPFFSCQAPSSRPSLDLLCSHLSAPPRLSCPTNAGPKSSSTSSPPTNATPAFLLALAARQLFTALPSALIFARCRQLLLLASRRLSCSSQPTAVATARPRLITRLLNLVCFSFSAAFDAFLIITTLTVCYSPYLAA
ncbi:hypothetical protein GOP47_0010092 [Adiantum capillus-veneris]|uniref:Uncharacterized protein n=1 Tax=Adiantum capillus-veneris TaxID=13818 RepID=A0A9D4UUG0_ADICA|nr:hypothetical protein GOP47_0010092 [Adiantum capillus-veneris]